MIENFILEAIERDVKSFVKVSDLYNHYKEYCESVNKTPLTQREFSFRFRKTGIAIKHRKIINRKSTHGWQGVKLK